MVTHTAAETPGSWVGAAKTRPLHPLHASCATISCITTPVPTETLLHQELTARNHSGHQGWGVAAGRRHSWGQGVALPCHGG